jgi:hypothetical protein
VATAIGFVSTIKPYFTACYRAHMLVHGDKFDLWDPAQVQQEFSQIVNNVQGGMMPASGCPEGVWDSTTSTQFLSDFNAWQAAGFPA